VVSLAPVPLAAARRKCNPDPWAPRVNVTILTTIPGTPSWRNESKESHVYEIMLALGENSRSAEVGEIRVLLDSGPPAESDDNNNNNATNDAVDDAAATRRLREDVAEGQSYFAAEKLDALASRDQLEKVTAHVYGRQPTYAELFRYASYALPHRLVALTNADVVLRNLDLLDASAFTTNTSLLTFVLAVRPPTGAFASACPRKRFPADRCEGWWLGGYSFDGFIFHSPLVATARYDFLEDFLPVPVLMNEGCAENRAAQFLSASGYAVVNPCLRNIAEHWHCGPDMHHLGGVRVYVKHPTPEYLALGGNGRVPAVKRLDDTPGLRCASSSSA